MCVVAENIPLMQKKLDLIQFFTLYTPQVPWKETI